MQNENNDIDIFLDKPLKLFSKSTDYGYSLIDVENTLKNMLALNAQQLHRVVVMPNSTILESIIAKIILRSNEKENFYGLEYLMDKAFGKSTEENNKGTNQPTSIVVKFENK
jgi:hypothetical protein